MKPERREFISPAPGHVFLRFSPEKEEAGELFTRLKKQRLECYLASSLPR